MNLESLATVIDDDDYQKGSTSLLILVPCPYQSSFDQLSHMPSITFMNQCHPCLKRN